MRKDERLRTIYETIAPHITRTEGAWRDYLNFAARFFKRSFDNVLLIYAQNPNAILLAKEPIICTDEISHHILHKGIFGMKPEDKQLLK